MQVLQFHRCRWLRIISEFRQYRRHKVVHIGDIRLAVEGFVCIYPVGICGHVGISAAGGTIYA